MLNSTGLTACHTCSGTSTSCDQPVCTKAQEIAERFANAHPCVGSGYCCKKSLCWEGQKAHPEAALSPPCPSLTWVEQDERYYCGLVLAADDPEPLMQSLHIGAGCCSSMNSDRAEILRRKR